MKEDEMGGACRTYVGNKNAYKIGLKGMDCVSLARNRNHWRTFVNVSMNLQVL